MEDDQQFCLRWNNHQSTLVAVFDTLLENGTLVDCTLAAEGKYLNAHKVVLSACSPYFESLLSQNYDKHPIFILKDVKFQELKAMMDYMYRGEVNISQDQLGALLKAAESLQIKGLSDNKKDSEPRKAAHPPPAKSPTPMSSTLPRVQGLTIEQRRANRSVDEREGSLSPGPRKRKRVRRRSTDDLDNHHDASNSSESHSNPTPNIPIPLPPASSSMKLLTADVPEPVETKSEIMSRHKILPATNEQEIPQVPIIKEKLETHTELMLEPKAEYVEEMNEDSIEDLTLDDDDVSNLDMSNDGAGPSHGNAGEGSSQGFGGWHMGNQNQDEVFLAAQEAVGAHRDSQGIMEDMQLSAQSFELFHETQSATVQVLLSDNLSVPSFISDMDTLISLETLPEDNTKTVKELKRRRSQRVPCTEYLTSNGYSCPKCGKLYNARKNLVRHLKIECGKEPQFICPYCDYKNHRRNEIKNHLRNKHSVLLVQ
ncbi:longitudinals lacking protein, isoforms A/B/D/L isoform X2 [Photinus pyralis]|nr:longitudinals lacking protein, isoforms A/B/D/L isoform X2 [Photinus pyralis]